MGVTAMDGELVVTIKLEGSASFRRLSIRAFGHALFLIVGEKVSRHGGITTAEGLWTWRYLSHMCVYRHSETAFWYEARDLGRWRQLAVEPAQ